MPLRCSMVVALAFFPLVARAQEGFDAHGFHLAAFDGDVRDPVTIQRPGEMHAGEWFAGGLLEFANAPLVYVVTDPSGTPVDEQAALDDVFALNTSFGYVVHDRIRLDATLPLFLTSTGLEGAQGVDLGDARLAALATLVTPDDDSGLGVGFVPYIDLPLGRATQFVGMGKVSGGAKAAATYELERFTLGGELGAFFGRSLGLSNLLGTDALTTGLAVGFHPKEDLGFTLEGHLASPFRSSAESGTAAPSEVLLSTRKTTDAGAHVAGGFAMAVTRGAGAAQYRLFVGGGFGQHGERVVDTDLDGLVDEVDTCPAEPETVNSYRDEDGCPDGPGKLVVLVNLDGRPMAGAKLVLQPADGAPTEVVVGEGPHMVDSFPDKTWRASASAGACLAGEAQITTTEGETWIEVALQPVRNAELVAVVHDPQGAPIATATATFTPQPGGCAPAEPAAVTGGRAAIPVGVGGHEVTVTAPGYQTVAQSAQVLAGESRTLDFELKPSKVQITEKQIVILDVVYFETSKAIIKPESFGLLDEVASTILSAPKIGRIEIGGHTDSQGVDATNLTLSQKRAEAVRDYLVKKGVPTGQLVPKGYGETKPIDTNATPAGRARNRRVEFNLLDAAAPR